MTEKQHIPTGERADFEAWVRRDWPGAPLRYIRDALPVNDPRYGQYCDDALQRAWVGWQARAAMVPSPTPNLVDALRQYQHNDGSGLVFGYDKAETERVVGALLAEVTRIKTIADNYYAICVERQQQIDAAQARVAELEKQEPVACMIRSRISHFRWDEEEQQSILWSEWAVATLTHGEAVTDPARNTPEVWQMKPLYAAPVAQAAQQPLKLSDDVREFLQEGINSVMGGEDADVDYEFANQLGKLLGPIYAAPAAQAGQVPEGWTVERVQPEDSIGFIIRPPRHAGVVGGTAVWSDAENPAEQLLALMLAAAPQPAKGGE